MYFEIYVFKIDNVNVGYDRAILRCCLQVHLLLTSTMMLPGSWGSKYYSGLLCLFIALCGRTFKTEIQVFL